MKLKLKNPINRKEFAKLLAGLIAGYEFDPWKPNENDDEFWKLDEGNNWSVKFFDDLNIFKIKYRYNNKINQFEEAFAGWLKVRVGAGVVE